MGGIRRWEEVRGRECRRKEEVQGFHPSTPQLFHKFNIKVKGPFPISFSNVTTPPPTTITKPYQRRVGGGKGKYEEVLEEVRGPRVQRSKGSKVPGFQGPRYLKLKFKYKLDSKEGPSCFFKLRLITT